MADAVSGSSELRSTGKVQRLEGRLVDGGQAVAIEIANGRIATVTPRAAPRHADGEQLPFISPGWIDLQINGAGPYDANGAVVDIETVRGLVGVAWSAGITGLLLTIITAPEDRMTRAFEIIAQACAADPMLASSILGIHVEGPHISAEDGPRGVHPAAHVRPPDLGEFDRWQRAASGRIRMVTIAPEWDGAVPYIRGLVDAGVVVSIGHTAANGEQIGAAVDAGATTSTHLGNGSHALIQRHPNYIWDQLNEDRLSAGFIFDGTLLPTSVIKPMLRAKGLERSFLVSDAVAVRGSTAGELECFDGTPVTVDDDGRVRVTGTPYFAGAVAMLPAGLSNALRFGGVALADAVALVTTNPARVLRESELRGHSAITVGAFANLTVFDHLASTNEIRVRQTVVDGNIVFEARAAP